MPAKRKCRESLWVPRKLNIPMIFFQHRLGRRKAGNRDTKWRTGDIIEPRVVAEADGVGIAAMLSADTKLEFFAGLAPPFRRNLYQFTNTIDVQRYKWIARDHALPEIVVQEHPGIVA